MAEHTRTTIGRGVGARLSSVRWERAVPIVGASAVFLVLLWFATAPYPSPADYAGLSLFCALVAVWCLVRRRPVESGGLLAGFVWLSLVGLAMTVVSSRAPEVSFDSAIVIGLAIVLFVLVAFGGLETKDVAAAFVLAVSVMAVDVLYESLQYTVTWFQTMDFLVPDASWAEKLPVTLPRESYSALSHNYTAMIGAMAIPLAISLWVVRTVPRWLVGLSLVLILGMIVATGSRGGWIATAAATVVAVLGIAWVRDPGRWRRVAKWSSLGIGALSLLFAALYVFGFRPAFLFRGTLDDRLPVMRAGWEMFLDRPWLGHGPGSFTWLVDGYLGSTYPGTEARVVWNNPHNGYVAWLAELGVIGSFLLLGSVLAVVWLSLRRIRRVPIEVASLRVGGAAALIGIGLHSLIEVPTLGLAPAGFGAVALGLLVSHEPVDQGRRLARFAAAGLAAVVGVGLYLGVGDSTDYTVGVSSMWRGEWASAVSAFDAVANGDPSTLVSRLRTVAALEAGIAVDLGEARSQAMGPPFSIAAWLNLVEAERRSGADYGRTIRSIIDSVPHDEVSSLQAGALLDSLGERQSADDLYLRALLMNPWMAGSSFWRDMEGGVEREHDLYRRAVAIAPCEIADELVLMEVWDSSMSPLVEDCPEAGAARISVALFEDRRVTIEPLLSGLISQAPDDVATRRLAGLDAMVSGDEDEAAKHWGIAALLGDPWATAELGSAYRGNLPARIEDLLRDNYQGYSPVVTGLGPSAVFYLDSARVGTVYRRPGPPSTLVRGPWIEATTVIHDRILELLEIES